MTSTDLAMNNLRFTDEIEADTFVSMQDIGFSSPTDCVRCCVRTFSFSSLSKGSRANDGVKIEQVLTR